MDDPEQNNLESSLTYAKQITTNLAGMFFVVIGSALLIASSVVGIRYQHGDPNCPNLVISLLMLFSTVFSATGGVFFGRSLMDMEPKEIKEELRLGQMYGQFFTVMVGLVFLLVASLISIYAGSVLFVNQGECNLLAVDQSVKCCFKDLSSAILAISGTFFTMVLAALMAMCVGLSNVCIMHYHLVFKMPKLDFMDHKKPTWREILWPTRLLKGKYNRITSFL